MWKDESKERMTKGQTESYFLLHMTILLIIRIISKSESACQDDSGRVRAHKKISDLDIRHYSLC